MRSPFRKDRGLGFRGAGFRVYRGLGLRLFEQRGFRRLSGISRVHRGRYQKLFSQGFVYFLRKLHMNQTPKPGSYRTLSTLRMSLNLLQCPWQEAAQDVGSKVMDSLERILYCLGSFVQKR